MMEVESVGHVFKTPMQASGVRGSPKHFVKLVRLKLNTKDLPLLNNDLRQKAMSAVLYRPINLREFMYVADRIVPDDS